MRVMIIVYNGSIQDVGRAVKENHVFIPVVELTTDEEDNKRYIEILFEDSESESNIGNSNSENLPPLSVLMGRFCVDEVEFARINFADYYTAFKDLIRDYNSGKVVQIEQLDKDVFAVINEIYMPEDSETEEKVNENPVVKEEVKTVTSKGTVLESKIFVVKDCPPEAFNQRLDKLN